MFSFRKHKNKFTKMTMNEACIDSLVADPQITFLTKEKNQQFGKQVSYHELYSVNSILCFGIIALLPVYTVELRWLEL